MDWVGEVGERESESSDVLPTRTSASNCKYWENRFGYGCCSSQFYGDLGIGKYKSVWYYDRDTGSMCYRISFSLTHLHQQSCEGGLHAKVSTIPALTLFIFFAVYVSSSLLEYYFCWRCGSPPFPLKKIQGHGKSLRLRFHHGFGRAGCCCSSLCLFCLSVLPISGTGVVAH